MAFVWRRLDEKITLNIGNCAQLITRNYVRAIVEHPAVKGIYREDCEIEQLTDNLALQALCRLRRVRRWTSHTAMTRRERERELEQLHIAHVNATLLPPDLAALVAAELNLDWGQLTENK